MAPVVEHPEPRLAKSFYPLGPHDGGDRLDRHLALFRGARFLVEIPRWPARGRGGRSLGGTWRRLLQCTEISDRALEAAGGFDLVQMGSLSHLGHRLPAPNRSILSQCVHLS